MERQAGYAYNVQSASLAVAVAPDDASLLGAREAPVVDGVLALLKIGPLLGRLLAEPLPLVLLRLDQALMPLLLPELAVVAGSIL